MKVRRIKWRDSRMYIAQHDRDLDYEVCVIESVGFVIEENKDYVVLAGDLVDDEVRRTIVIPRENFVK
jgi:hypothetical protein